MFRTPAGSFTTGLSTDTTGPSLLVASPAQAATAVPLNTDVVLQFSKPINPVTRAAGVQILFGNAGAWQVHVLDRQPGADVPAQRQPRGEHGVQRVVTAQLTDVAGNSVANPGTLSFTTGTATDRTGPQVTSIRPQSNSENVGVNVDARSDVQRAHQSGQRQR